mmetsp:Transcript_37023/g.78512  ORF Transcript_37023/g.78512 Transcript_37023/m.78512 type:complete len:114 (-) Transcript_37023:129-470(-)
MIQMNRSTATSSASASYGSTQGRVPAPCDCNAEVKKTKKKKKKKQKKKKREWMANQQSRPFTSRGRGLVELDTHSSLWTLYKAWPQGGKARSPRPCSQWLDSIFRTNAVAIDA